MKTLCLIILALAVSPALQAQDAAVAPVTSSTNAPVANVATNSPRGSTVEARSRNNRSSTNSGSSTNRSTTPLKPADNVRLISSRNIFDQSRRPGVVSNGNTRRQTTAPRVESFGLVGTMLTAKGDTAFFAGSSIYYQKSLKKGESIGGYKIDNITPKSVSLLSTNAPMEMKIGNYLRRENEGAWILSAMPEPAPLTSTASESTSSSSTTTTSSTPTSSAGSAELSDVMKAMIERRERELSK